MASIEEIRAALGAAQDLTQEVHGQCLEAHLKAQRAKGLVIEVTRGSSHDKAESVARLLARAEEVLGEIAGVAAQAEAHLHEYVSSL